MDTNDSGNGKNKISRDSDERRNISGVNLFVLSVMSAAVYLLLSLLIFCFIHDRALDSAFDHGLAVSGQLMSGIMAGSVAAAVIGFIMSRPPVSEVLHDFYIVRFLSQTRLTPFDRMQLSFFAGVGEELLFRGTVQPLIGIWLTSLIFVGIHGYFKFKSVGHILFGLMMFGLSMGLGYLFEIAGLIAAMTAHAVYDLIMLKLVQRKN